MFQAALTFGQPYVVMNNTQSGDASHTNEQILVFVGTETDPEDTSDSLARSLLATIEGRIQGQPASAVPMISSGAESTQPETEDDHLSEKEVDDILEGFEEDAWRLGEER